jgi:hypothetical protein
MGPAIAAALSYQFFRHLVENWPRQKPVRDDECRDHGKSKTKSRNLCGVFGFSGGPPNPVQDAPWPVRAR